MKILLALLAFWIIGVGVVVIFMKGTKGCGGNCEQGRKTCDCCDDYKK